MSIREETESINHILLRIKIPKQSSQGAMVRTGEALALHAAVSARSLV